MGKRHIYLMTLVFLLASTAALPAAEVKNVKASQVGNRVQLTYDLEGEGETEVNVTITVKGQAYSSDKLHLEGDFGRVKPGNGKKIWWNVLQDFPRGVSDDVEWNVDAVRTGPISGSMPLPRNILGGKIDKDSSLTLSNSPYRIAKDILITGGATLFIESGVTILYDQNTAITVEDGGIIARGRKEMPITFTAYSTSPMPGYYACAVRFIKPTRTKSIFSPENAPLSYYNH